MADPVLQQQKVNVGRLGTIEQNGITLKLCAHDI